MKVPNRPIGAWEYVPPEDREKKAEEQTVFVLSPMTQAERMVMWDEGNHIHVEADGTKVIRQRGYQQAQEICRAHVVDIRNLQDANGAVIPFPKNGNQEERWQVLERLDDIDIYLIAQEVRNRSSIGVEEKNLSAPMAT